MRQFFRNVFYTDFPARGAFAGIILFLSGSWSCVCLLAASGLLHGVIFYPRTGFPTLITALLFLTPILLAGYALYTNYRFLFTCGGFKRILKHPLELTGNILCLALAVYGLYHSFEIFFLADHFLTCHSVHGSFMQQTMLPASCRTTAVFAGLFFLFLWLLSTAKLMAAAEDLPLSKMFGKTVKVVFAVLCCVLISVNFLRHCSQKELYKKTAELEKTAGSSIDVESFCKRYYGTRKPDPEFWAKADQLQKKNVEFNFYFLQSPVQVEPDPEIAKLWQKQLSSDEYFKEWNALLAAPPPLRKLQIKKGSFLTHFHSSSQLRRVAVLEFWRLRFALNSRDSDTVVDALEKMRFCRESLINDLWYPAAVTMMVVEKFRIKALERAISAGLLTNGQLLRQKTQIAHLRKRLPEIRKNMLFAEAVLVFDWLSSSYEKVQKFRFLFPAATYLWNRNLTNCVRILICAYQNRNCPLPRDSTGILAPSVLPNLTEFDIRLKQLESLCLAMEKIIDLHLARRRTGKYPEYPETLPSDPFTGQEMLYRKGEILLPRLIFSEQFPNGRKTLVPTQAITISSSRKSGTDDAENIFNDDIGVCILLLPEKVSGKILKK